MVWYWIYSFWGTGHAGYSIWGGMASPIGRITQQLSNHSPWLSMIYHYYPLIIHYWHRLIIINQWLTIIFVVAILSLSQDRLIPAARKGAETRDTAACLQWATRKLVLSSSVGQVFLWKNAKCSKPATRFGWFLILDFFFAGFLRTFCHRRPSSFALGSGLHFWRMEWRKGLETVNVWLWKFQHLGFTKRFCVFFAHNVN